MDERNSKHTTSYDRVMPRVYNRSHPSTKANSKVTRHDTSSTCIGAKASSSNLSSSVFRELPLVLSGYEPETPLVKPIAPKYVAKPRRTLKSLDPGKSPLVPGRNRQGRENNRNNIVRSSAPCVTDSEPVGWSDAHLRQCYSSRSHTRLKELKDEIKAFQKTQKLMQLRSHLYKKCGVVLDDGGQVAVDKAVQVQTDNASGDEISDNPGCVCDDSASESIIHLLMDCPQHAAAREDLQQELQMKLCTDSVPTILSEASGRDAFLEYASRIARIAIARNRTNDRDA